jgi:hypothetical protein
VEESNRQTRWLVFLLTIGGPSGNRGKSLPAPRIAVGESWRLGHVEFSQHPADKPHYRLVERVGGMMVG